MSAELRAFLSRLRPGVPVSLGDLTVVPLLWDGAAGPDADLLEEGLGGGRTQVTEVGESGSVNSVRVSHSGVRMLLLVDGEQIEGAKQNRVLNASFLVPPGASVVLPVSCVERGRWRATSPGFGASETTLSAVARADKLRRVARSVAAKRGYDAGQGEVWRDVDTYMERTRTRSPTAAFADAYASRAGEVESRIGRLSPVAGQVGIAAVRAGKLVALDAFGSPDLWARGWKKIARGLLAEPWGGSTADPDAVRVVERALEAISRADPTRESAPGAGETLHGSAPGAVVGAVVHGGSVYHAVVAAA